MLKLLTLAKTSKAICIFFFLDFLKQHKVLRICPKFQVFNILIRNNAGEVIPQEQIRNRNTKVEIGLNHENLENILKEYQRLNLLQINIITKE